MASWSEPSGIKPVRIPARSSLVLVFLSQGKPRSHRVGHLESC